MRVASGVRFRPPAGGDAGLKTGGPSRGSCHLPGAGADGLPPEQPGLTDIGARTVPGTMIPS